MSDVEWRAFVLERGRTAKLATVRADGRPHVAPIWVDLDDDGTVVFTTASSSVKGRNLARDPRCMLSIDEEQPPFAFVLIEGRAELSEDVDEMLVWSTRIAGRYMGAELAGAYGRRNAVEGELLVRVRPEKVNAQRGISD